MTRYSRLRQLVFLGGLVAAGASALLAAPGSATIVCPKGTTPPSPYCTNVPPIAITGNASHVRATSARLNGVAGPNVRGGDITRYFFEYGTTIAYGSQTHPGTIGSCPYGITPPSPYCRVPKKRRVSADVWKLTPCTTYHFQLVAHNPDGLADGGDNAFTTRFAPPLADMFAPGDVRAGNSFSLELKLRYDTESVTALVARTHHDTVESIDFGPLSAGRHSETITAPGKKGNYVLAVLAKLSCGEQSAEQRLRVDEPNASSPGHHRRSHAAR